MCYADHADYFELHPATRGLRLPCLVDLDHGVGVDDMLSDLWELCMLCSLETLERQRDKSDDGRIGHAHGWSTINLLSEP